MKTVWKLIFPGLFIALLVIFTEVRVNESKPQDIKSTDRFPDLCKQMTIQQLIPVSGHTKITYDFIIPVFERT